MLKRSAFLLSGLCMVCASFANVACAQAASRSSDLVNLMQTCAPNVHPSTMGAIIKTESAGHAFALADAGPKDLPWSVRKNMVRSFYPGSADEAERMVADLVGRGHIVAIGLTQVNVKNLRGMGLTVREVLDPCTNLKAGAQILSDFYARAVKKYGPGERALDAAISAYNTGDFTRGIDNGYVDLVYAAGRLQVPALKLGGKSRTAEAVATNTDTDAPRSAKKSRSRSMHGNSSMEAKFSKLEVETF